LFWNRSFKNWHVYRKWNESLFNEMYEAYDHARLLLAAGEEEGSQDPAEGWYYESELWFFDNYVAIPAFGKETGSM
jgi:hypothetical protein